MSDDRPIRLDEWKVIGREKILSRKPWIDVWEETLELPDGRVVEEFCLDG